MTISQLAKIAVDEDRVVNISNPTFAEHGYYVRLEADSAPMLVRDNQVQHKIRLKAESLAMDDWYEV